MLILVTGYALEPCERGDHRQQQVQLRVLGHVRLDEQRGDPGIEAGRQPVDEHVAYLLLQVQGLVVAGREHVPVGHEEETLVLVLQFHPVAQRAVIVAEVQPAGGPHAGQDTPRRCRRAHATDKAVAHERNYSARPVIGPRSPLPLRTITGGVTDRSTTVVGSMPQSPPSSTRVNLVLESRLDLAPFGQRLRIRRQDQRGAHQRLAQLGEQQARHRMVGDAHADGAPSRVLQAARRLACGAQQERIRAGQAGAKYAELPGVEPREAPDLRKIRAHQGEVVMTVGLTDCGARAPARPCRRCASRARNRNRSDRR